ncbi:MAG: HAMP domain-containing protein [Defluviitaleaceae bacterium]|nr:HAMP domain-containing protein [Defluviitaleaceae bacterium]
MNTTLGKQILLLFFIPVIVIFIVISLGIYSAASNYVNDRIQLEMRGLTETNAAALSGQINSVRVAVSSMSTILGNYNYTLENARPEVESLVHSLFTNDTIYNVRLVFEPQAFDGRDSRHRRDYVGAPSGRFIRSYIAHDGEAFLVHDLDEEWLDDAAYADWYVTPTETGEVYMDVNSERANTRYYGRGSDMMYTLTISAPIYRDTRIIGVISADMSVDTLMDTSHYFHAAQESTVAMFYSSGRVFYSPRLELSEASVNGLGFSNTSMIWRTFRNRNALLITEENCPFSRTRSFVLFQPVYIADYDDVLFLYVSLPRSIYYRSLMPVLVYILPASAMILALLLFILMYAVRKVSRPISQLNHAATAIAQGNIEVAIEYSPNAQNEIGLLSKSLHTMVEQFRVNAMVMEQAQMESTIKSHIVHYITASGDKNTIFKGLASVFCKYFQIHKTTIVCMDAKRDIAYSNDLPPYDFDAHDKVEALLAERRILFLNTQTIVSQKIRFLHEKTTSVCLIPLRKERLLGYVIFENEASGSFPAGTEAIMIYISSMLSSWLAKKDWEEKPEQAEPSEAEGAAQEAEPQTVLEKLRRIKEINVDSALERMGGLEDAYEKTVRLLTRLLPDTMAKLDLFLAEENLKGFTIEIHGLKGVLRNIGAANLGNDAANLEKASLEANIDFCSTHYPPLRELLVEFSKQLNNAIKEDESVVKQTMDLEVLKVALEEAKEAADGYEATAAIEILEPLTAFSYNSEVDELLKKVIFALEEFDCEEALVNMAIIEEQI